MKFAPIQFALLAAVFAWGSLGAATVNADPCGMVPPIFTGPGNPITRIGLQQTYVFYKDGVESFVIRPGFRGKVDNFGMLIPFPNPPSLRKVPDNVFDQISNAVDPPEVVVDLRWSPMEDRQANGIVTQSALGDDDNAKYDKRKVVVLNREAVGMYEVAVLSAGSAEALKIWMEQNKFQYPDGMDDVAEEYIAEKWCFVAVKTKVGIKAGTDPKPGQRKLSPDMPAGSSFDGSVQGMGFRFKTDELVVPMRLSTFNGGDTRNVVYLLTDGPRKIQAIPEEYVVRQLSGKQLVQNLTGPLPLRLIGGTIKDIPEWRKKNLKQERNADPFVGVARNLFASDMAAIKNKDLEMEHERTEKALLAVGEHFGLRGPEVDALNVAAIQEVADAATEQAVEELSKMTLTVVDGDFPRAVLAKQNLKFAEFQMAQKRNRSRLYDTKLKGPRPPAVGRLFSSYETFDPAAGQMVDSRTGETALGVVEIGRRKESGSPVVFGSMALLVLILGTGFGTEMGRRRKNDTRRED